MTTAERICQQSRELPETEAKSVLDFIEFLKEKLRRNTARQQAAVDLSEFDQFGAAYDGTFDRNACYDWPAAALSLACS